jgi:hypothetical protein
MHRRSLLRMAVNLTQFGYPRTAIRRSFLTHVVTTGVSVQRSERWE